MYWSIILTFLPCLSVAGVNRRLGNWLLCGFSTGELLGFFWTFGELLWVKVAMHAR